MWSPPRAKRTRPTAHFVTNTSQQLAPAPSGRRDAASMLAPQQLRADNRRIQRIVIDEPHVALMTPPTTPVRDNHPVTPRRRDPTPPSEAPDAPICADGAGTVSHRSASRVLCGPGLPDPGVPRRWDATRMARSLLRELLVRSPANVAGPRYTVRAIEVDSGWGAR